MRILSMWQPWASFLLYPTNAMPVKRWETRAFPPRQTLPLEVAIHATLRRDALRDLMHLPEFVEAQRRAGIHHFPLGAIIGVATIVEVIRTEEVGHRAMGAPTPDALDLKLGDYHAGRYAWRMAFASPLRERIPFKGRQSVLWDAPAELEAAIRAQLRAPD